MSLSLAASMASTPAMRKIFDARGGVAAMLAVEAAYAKANAALGLIPEDASVAIVEACDAGGIDIEELAAAGTHAGTVVIPLVAWLRSQVPHHAAYVHVGGTSQDIIDTALVLQLRHGLARLAADLAAAAQATAKLAHDYCAAPTLARTLMQPALPTSFGLKAAYWLLILDDARIALRDASRLALCLQCGGAAGTLDGFDENADRFIMALAKELDLSIPALPWHTRRAPLARLGCAIAAAVGALGKIAGDVILMMQPELGEVSEPSAPRRGGSSAMAHKRNPTLSIQVRAAALRAPHLAAGLLAAVAQEHERAAGAWQAEQSIWPELMLASSGAFSALRETLEGLEVNTEAMEKNLASFQTARPSQAIPELIARALDAHAKLNLDLHYDR